MKGRGSAREWVMSHTLSVRWLAVPVQAIPDDGVAEGIVPSRAIPSVQDSVPAWTLDVAEALHRCLALRTGDGAGGFVLGRVPRDGLRWLHAE